MPVIMLSRLGPCCVNDAATFKDGVIDKASATAAAMAAVGGHYVVRSQKNSPASMEIRRSAWS
jgi:hypothetical protein